jgi:glycosyltransferase involved in cell wall biosynthesis
VAGILAAAGCGQPFSFLMKLVVVSHVAHYKKDRQLYAYAPYAREIEVWADMFDQVIIAAPLRQTAPAGDCGPVDRSNVQIMPQRELGGETWIAKIKLACYLPAMIWDLSRTLRQGDAIHVRCPGNLGFLGAILAPIFSKNVVAKFAGQWNLTPAEPLSVRLQKWLLASGWWRGPVTVYGNWPNQRKRIIPFFSAALTANQITRAGLALQKRAPEENRNILFVGRLSRAKNVDVLLAALAQLKGEGILFRCTIAGAGPELSVLQELSDKLSLGDSVEFTGGLSFDNVLEQYERSGILVLASQTEGWPKAIAEGMAFGLIAIGSNLGLIPQMLGNGRGYLVEPRDKEALTNTLRNILTNPERQSAMRVRAAAWAKNYSLDSLRSSLQALLTEHWGAPATRGLKQQHIDSTTCIHE